MHRKHFLFAMCVAPFLAACEIARPQERNMTVFKDPTCGCCGNWVEHLRANGFIVEVQETNDTAGTSRQYGVPTELRGCHTGIAGGYTIEGHVPAEDILRLLRERPDAKGLAVPGMPKSSPGMGVPGQTHEPYTVVAFARDGKTSVFAQH